MGRQFQALVPPLAPPVCSQTGKSPYHVAMILDGNGRWAERRGLSRMEGHAAGIRRVYEVLEQAIDLGIKVRAP
jgi:undecaprenyl pyrophosphate synthase